MSTVTNQWPLLESIAKEWAKQPSRTHELRARRQLTQISNVFRDWFNEAKSTFPDDVESLANRVQFSLDSLKSYARTVFGIDLRLPKLRFPRSKHNESTHHSKLPDSSKCMYHAHVAATWGRICDLDWLLDDPTTRRAAIMLDQQMNG